jgi:hypothetical protein
MVLVDDLQALRNRALADLNAAHDYYADTTTAWDIVGKFVQGGQVFSVRYPTTGTVRTQAELAAKAQGYLAEQVAEATFQQFISIFENYFFDLLHLWLMAYPKNLIGKKVDFKAVLDAPDKDAITLLVVCKELTEVLYERPTGWFAYLEDKVKLGCPTPDEIVQVAEAKATRDMLVHNRGMANKIYESKAGKLARYKDGQRIEILEPYHRATWELLFKVITDISNATIAKVS